MRLPEEMKNDYMNLFLRSLWKDEWTYDQIGGYGVVIHSYRSPDLVAGDCTIIFSLNYDESVILPVMHADVQVKVGETWTSFKLKFNWFRFRPHIKRMKQKIRDRKEDAKRDILRSAIKGVKSNG